MTGRPIMVLRLANAEIDGAEAWYEDQRAGLGREFLVEVRATLRTIAERPESFPFGYRHARRALVARFQYKVYFLLPETSELIVVVAVLHGRQSTARLRRRV